MNAVIPSVGNAPLPATYERAKSALAECSRVDECKDWADKAQALASYARQSDDETLFNLARRIQARAMRRAGELLKTFQGGGGQGARKDLRSTVGTGPTSQRAAAASAGMSERQEKTAVRIANVPELAFEGVVESGAPPSMTRLAEMGKDSAPKPEGFQAATHTVGALRRFVEKCEEHAPEFVARGVLPHEVDEVRRLVGRADAWLDRFIINVGR